MVPPCVWDEILVTVDGFGAAMWAKYAQSQGFVIFGAARAGGGGGGLGESRTGSYMLPFPVPTILPLLCTIAYKLSSSRLQAMLQHDCAT